MARTSLTQLSVLFLTILCATEAWSKNVPLGNRVNLQRLVSSTKCSLGPLQLSISCTKMGLMDVPPDLYPGVEELDLSDNHIEFLSNTSFTPYQSIIKLSLFFNYLIEIAPDSFYSLPELQYLDLGDNPMLDIITSDMFRFSKKLTHLSVSKCSLGEIPSDILQWLPALHLLDLSYNRLFSVNISCNSAIQNLTIDLRGNRFRALTSDRFRIDCQLDFLNLNQSEVFVFAVEPVAIATIRSRSLSLGHTHLSPEVWPYFFTGIRDSEVRKLLLSDTNLGNIDPRNFSLLQGKLRVLDLSNNKLSSDFAKMGFLNLSFLSTLILNKCTIHDIDPTYFSRMKGLRVLQLNNNNIVSIGDINSNSSWDIDLEELHLAYNSLEKIHERSLMGLGNLTKLVLRGNKDLYEVRISAIAGLNKLQYLDLSGCLQFYGKLYVPKLETFIYSNCERLENMESIREAFSHIGSFKHIFLGNSSLNSLWTPYTANNISLFEGMRNLTTLDVKRNQIKLLQDGLFADLEYLILLDLSNCQIEVIETNAFEGLDRLHTLYLQGNHLQYLPNRVLMNAGQIHHIRLDGNKLRYLGEDLFFNKSKLQNLTIADNRLTTVNLSTFQPIYNSLSLIDISANELGCTCDLKWLPKWLGGSITVVNENDTRCSLASITEMRGKPIMSFNPADFCGPNIALYCSLPLVITWIVVMGIFAYRHRWFLKYKLFLLKLAILGYQEIKDARDLDDFEFHVNIMFAEEDEEWVWNDLRPVLEERLPEYNENVYGDNFLPLGMYYCDAVHYVVQRSYKTVILVSRAAIQDNWFLIKFRTAADQVNDTKIENMVVIFLEDIPDDELPFLVRLYLSDRKPYLGWEGDDEGFQEYFWQKLIKMLTINLRRNNVIPPE